MTTISEIRRLLKQGRYDVALPIIERALRDAAEKSPEGITQVAREIVAWKGFFANARDAAASEPYFRSVLTIMEELGGPQSAAAMSAAENLAGLLGSVNQFSEAIVLRERVFAYVRARYPIDDPRFMNVRDGLVFLYRRAGKEEAAEELYFDTGICEHLKPAEEYLRKLGSKVVSAGRPWSENCHIWVYFDRVIDCEGLIKTLPLDSSIQIHDHRGTHDGSERGLTCPFDKDAVMGRHPLDA